MRRTGVEEEYLFVDDDGVLKNLPGAVPRAAEEIGELSQPEIALTQAETATPICESTDETRHHLALAREALARAAEEEGGHMIVAGTAPGGGWERQTITPKERYEKLAERMRRLAWDQAIAGMHVHVEVADLEEAVRICDQSKLALPLLLALSTSSPIWEGADTGYHSWRSIWFGRWPTGGPAANMGSASRYEDLVAQLQTAGIIDDGSNLYWDIRPSIRYPTVEIRTADVCTRLEDSIALAALSRATAEWAAEQNEPIIPSEVARGARWRAARDGTTGNLVALDGREKPAAQAIDELLQAVRPHLGTDRELVETQTKKILTEGTSAQIQKQLHPRGTRAITHWLQETGTPSAPEQEGRTLRKR